MSAAAARTSTRTSTLRFSPPSTVLPQRTEPPMTDPIRAHLDSMWATHRPVINVAAFTGREYRSCACCALLWPCAASIGIAALLAVLDQCDAPTTLIAFTSENQRTPVVKVDLLRAAIAEALGVEPAAAGRADGSEPR